MLSSLDRGGVGREMPIQRISQGVRDRSSFDRREDAKREAPPRCQHSEHLCQRSDTIREELQAQLAQNHIEGSIWEWHVKDAAFVPLNHWPPVLGNSSCNGQHAGVEV
jgi:hypothetical protein